MKRTSKKWLSKHSPPSRVKKLWKTVIGSSNSHLNEKAHAAWKDAVIELIAIADESSAGFGIDDPSDENVYSVTYCALYENFNQNTDVLQTVCLSVPPQVCCVLPKTLTSQVGCSLNNLSHHLALLPRDSQVKPFWQIHGSAYNSREPLNLLVIPFPYDVDAKCFVDAGSIIDNGIDAHAGSSSKHFSVTQKWIESSGGESGVLERILDMVKRGVSKCGIIHGIVMPELSLSQRISTRLVDKLKRISGLEFFVSGVLGESSENEFPRNKAMIYLFIMDSSPDKVKVLEIEQNKHHRWKLDKSQIERYNLANSLSPNYSWWEGIDISGREINFSVFRQGATMAVLVCEDLARIDPVQKVLRAVGPNLLIALLQDGEQRRDRWGARYATVFAEDPGSSVLTVTSRGMIKRAVLGSSSQLEYRVALWQDSLGGLRELVLREGEEALILHIGQQSKEHWTLDGRSDYQQSQILTLDSVEVLDGI